MPAVFHIENNKKGWFKDQPERLKQQKPNQSKNLKAETIGASLALPAQTLKKQMT